MKSISEQAYLIGKADDYLAKVRKLLTDAGFNSHDIGTIDTLRTLCDVMINKIKAE